MMNLVNAILAETETLPAMDALGYQYVLAGNGLFIRAEDSRLAALVQISPVQLHGLATLEPSVELKLPRVPHRFMLSILESARRHLPNEAMYQLWFAGDAWRISMPAQKTTPTAAHFDDNPATAIDLHSHATTNPFFSSTDDDDEKGFRLYVVIGHVESDTPEILCRVGVYGHHMLISAETIFDALGSFRDAFDAARAEQYADESAAAEITDDPSIEAEPIIQETASGLLIARY